MTIVDLRGDFFKLLTYAWFVQLRNRNVPVLGVLIKYKAKEIRQL